VRRLVLGTLRAYQRHVSPLKPFSCRFCPKCSEYTIQVVEKYGVVKGLVLGARRVARCHPFHPSGYDPVL